MKTLRIAIAALLFCGAGFAQQVLRWSATTGDVSLSGATTAATVQQPATNASQVYLDQIVVRCSVTCVITQKANGTAATTTAGTVRPILPTQLNTTIPVNFFTASNVGAGTQQGGTFTLESAGTVVLCLTTSCGNPADVIMGTGGGTAVNYTVSIGSITGTVNITFYGRASS